MPAVSELSIRSRPVDGGYYTVKAVKAVKARVIYGSLLKFKRGVC